MIGIISLKSRASRLWIYFLIWRVSQSGTNELNEERTFRQSPEEIARGSAQ